MCAEAPGRRQKRGRARRGREAAITGVGMATWHCGGNGDWAGKRQERQGSGTRRHGNGEGGIAVARLGGKAAGEKQGSGNHRRPASQRVSKLRAVAAPAVEQECTPANGSRRSAARDLRLLRRATRADARAGHAAQDLRVLQRAARADARAGPGAQATAQSCRHPGRRPHTEGQTFQSKAESQ